jgi:hypothetical protein
MQVQRRSRAQLLRTAKQRAYVPCSCHLPRAEVYCGMDILIGCSWESNKPLDPNAVPRELVPSRDPGLPRELVPSRDPRLSVRRPHSDALLHIRGVSPPSCRDSAASTSAASRYLRAAPFRSSGSVQAVSRHGCCFPC